MVEALTSGLPGTVLPGSLPVIKTGGVAELGGALSRPTYPALVCRVGQVGPDLVVGGLSRLAYPEPSCRVGW
jgi:hypothetical protein